MGAANYKYYENSTSEQLTRPTSIYNLDKVLNIRPVIIIMQWKKHFIEHKIQSYLQ